MPFTTTEALGKTHVSAISGPWSWVRATTQQHVVEIVEDNVGFPYGAIARFIDLKTLHPLPVPVQPDVYADLKQLRALIDLDAFHIRCGFFWRVPKGVRATRH